MFREMVRKKQELPADEAIALLKKEPRGVLSVLGDNGYPYGVPIDHWYNEEDGWIYFHSGKEGHKVDAIRSCDKASFCIYDEGFRINRETLAKDGKFVYTITEVVYDPGHGITPAETYMTKQLLEDNHPLLPEYYERVKHGVELTIFGLKRANDDQLPIYETILSDLTAMEERIYGNRT